MPTISVVVPVYKVEEYLEVCVQSILKQTFSDFELILVDDGSPDRCGDMCEEFALVDSRIRVIHQENQGLSGARNSGMDIATGTYITFIDSDDVVADSYLSTLYGIIRRENADVAICSSCDLNEDEMHNIKAHISREIPMNICFEHNSAIIALYNGDPRISIGSTCKLYRYESIVDLRFPVGRLHEDQAFTPIALYRMPKVVFTDAQIYFYRVHTESITHKKFSVKRYDDLWAIDSCIRFFESKGEQEIVAAAKKKRQRLLSAYAIYAWRDQVEVPQEYRMNILKAVLYLRKNVADEKYQYYLAQIHPRLALIHEYWRKIKKLLHLT